MSYESSPAYLQRAAVREDLGLDPDFLDPFWERIDEDEQWRQSLHEDEGDDE